MTRERLQVAAYLFVVIIAAVSIAVYDANQRDVTKRQIIERIEPQIKRIERTVIQQGEPGKTGAAGKNGKSITGNTGAPGRAGLLGITGPQGPRGPQGVKGDKGEKGDRGPFGPLGPVGPAGPAGPVTQLTQAQLNSITAQVRALVCANLPPTLRC